MPGDVLLLRSPSDDGGPDKYEAAFRARKYRALSIPVLETVYMHADELLSIVRAGGHIQDKEDERYTGVIVTSGRACEAWFAAAQKLQDAGASGEGWSTIPFYAVGEATSNALSAIHASFPSSPYTPHDVRGGAESGTAEKLAHFIISDLSSSSSSPSVPSGAGAQRRLLYLTGDKNRDVLPNVLADAHFELDTLEVYATQGSSKFEADLRNALDGVQALDPDRPEHWWIVHFAPSSAKHVFPILRTHFDFPSAGEPEKTAARRRARIAAIGPTTSTFLEEELNVKVDVVPAKPNPEALVEDIARWDSDHAF